MFKNIKRIAAIILAIALCFVFAACHEKGEIAVKVSYEGHTDEFTSGFYACALLYADMEAQQLLSTTLSESQLYSADFDYLEQEIEGKKYEDWVKERALEICKEVFAYKVMCETNKVPTADILADASALATTYWSSYSEMMTPNGVSLETFKTYSEYQEYKTAYFNFLYGAEGPEEIANKEIETFLKEKYMYVNVLSFDISTLSEEKAEEKVKEFKKYLSRIKKGENFGKIYAEANDGTYTANKDDDGVFNNDSATIWGAEGTMYENVYFDKVKGLKNGEGKVFTTNDEQGKYVILVVKGNILQKGNTYLETLKDNVRHELKDEEFEKAMAERIKKVELEEITWATSPFKVDKIVYPSNY